MATPMTPSQIKAAFTKWGVPFEEHEGWATHRRDPAHGAWGPVNGLLLHHTGDDAPDSSDENVLWNGRSGLPGPLCTWGMRDDGVAVLIGGGRSNHAGGGDPHVLDAVINESYTDYPPKPHYHQGSAGAVDGNVHFYGQETMYSGTKRMTAKAYRSTVLAFAAVCDHHGWSGKSAIGHKEWSDWKPDPGSLDMKAFRADVDAALKAGPGRWPTAPTVPTQKEPTVATQDTTAQDRSTADPAATVPVWYFGMGLDLVAAAMGAREAAGGVITSLQSAKAFINAGKRVVLVGGPAVAAVGDVTGKSNVLIANGHDAGETLRLATTTE